jgi:hypothetical protein
VFGVVLGFQIKLDFLHPAELLSTGVQMCKLFDRMPRRLILIFPRRNTQLSIIRKMKTAPWLVGTVLQQNPRIVVADKRLCLLSANNGFNNLDNNHAACNS